MKDALSAERRAAYGEALDLLAKKLVEDERTLGVEFPYVTAPDGSWRTMPASRSAGYAGDAWSHGNWFCGFWVGLHLAAHFWTGEQRYLDFAKERMVLVAPRAADPNTHDIGFIFWGSAIPLFHVTGDPHYASLALSAADRLRARLITTPKGAFISSWGPLADLRGRKSSAIDTMANLPLLYWAADHTDDGSFRLAAEAHALMTRAAFVRADLSTYHAVEYDLASGERTRGFTFQGAFDESCWPRGQAWAIYGFAATARATGKPNIWSSPSGSPTTTSPVSTTASCPTGTSTTRRSRTHRATLPRARSSRPRSWTSQPSTPMRPRPHAGRSRPAVCWIRSAKTTSRASPATAGC